jgi:DNA-binding transcriptional ArsR family regulator
MSKLKPNFTQTPNIFFDEIMSELGHAETKCLLYIFRRTYGFQKESDKISLTQFETGMKNRDGEVLDKGTGLSRKSIFQALQNLSDKGIVIVDKQGNINRYFLNLATELGTQVYQGRYVSTPELGTQVNIQKKEKESIQKKEDLSPLFETIWNLYNFKKGKKKALTKFETIAKNSSNFQLLVENMKKAIPNYLEHLASETWKQQKQLEFWLNGECWNDEYEIKKTGKQSNIIHAQDDKYSKVHVTKG